MSRARTTTANVPPAPPAAKTVGTLRVAKRYLPHQHGARRFALRHGEPLVCVRQRLSADGQMRYTTVELLVEVTPVASHANRQVAVTLPMADRDMRQRLLALGSTWNSSTQQWTVPYPAAKRLGLLQSAKPLRGK